MADTRHDNACLDNTDSEEQRRLLQGRMALYLRSFALLSAGLLLLAVFLAAALVSLEFAVADAQRSDRLVLLLLALFVGGCWLAVRRGRPSRRLLHNIDLLSTIGATLLASTSITLQGLGPRHAVLISQAVGYILILRAALVPSEGRRTLRLSVAAALAALGVAGLFAIWSPLTSGHRYALETFFALLLVWLTFGCAIATIISRVIFGLRREAGLASTVGQYVLEHQIGQGGMGVVYRARHALLRRDTAVKLLAESTADRDAVARFEREVTYTARLSHPNTVAIFDYGRTLDGVFYYAMEYVDGIDLQQLLNRYGPQPPGRVAHLLFQVLASLAEAHAMGLVHRDVKPANIMLTDRCAGPDTVKVLDFGLVRHLVVDDPGETLAGTPLYLAPEIIADPCSQDAAADLYAVAAVGYLLLAGSPPFRGPSLREVLTQHCNAPVEPPSQRSNRPVPAALEQLVLQGLSKKPSERPSAIAFREALRACAAGWTEGDARRWWQTYRAQLGDRPSASPPEARTSGAGQPLTIELPDRLAALQSASLPNGPPREGSRLGGDVR
jgi:serine/threonine-protein kinase